MEGEGLCQCKECKKTLPIEHFPFATKGLDTQQKVCRRCRNGRRYRAERKQKNSEIIPDNLKEKTKDDTSRLRREGLAGKTVLPPGHPLTFKMPGFVWEDGKAVYKGPS